MVAVISIMEDSFGCRRVCMRIKSILFWLGLSSFLFIGCVKGDGAKSEEASISVGQIANLENATIKVLLTEENGSQEVISGTALGERKFKAGTKIKIGIQVEVDQKLYAESKQDNSDCPFVEVTLAAGKNTIPVVACKIKDGGTIESRDDESSSSSSSSNSGSGSRLTEGKDCEGGTVYNEYGAYRCTTITKDLSASEEIYSGCFKELNSVCNGKYSEIKCSETENVSATVFVGCDSDFTSSDSSESDRCSYNNGLLQCGSKEVSAVKAAKVKYL